MWDRWTRRWRLTRRSAQRLQHRTGSDDKDKADDRKPRPMATKPKKPSPTKTRTGNALAQFVILSALTVVAYQFLATHLLSSASDASLHGVDGISASSGGGSPSPWTDAALEKYRAKQRAASDREVISTTEFSCFMACVGLFGLMQRKKKKSEEEAIEAQRRAVEARILRGRATSDSAISPSATAVPTQRGEDALVVLPSDVQVELLTFLSAEDLVECAMVNRAWHHATGDSSETLWRNIFTRDVGESGERFIGLVPRVCWRQYYFLHRLSRAVELARWLDHVQQRKCVVIQGNVYDVTSFLDAHPGGYHVIGDVLGTDATELWDQFQHSMEAKELMKDFLVQDDVLANATSADAKNLAVVKNRWRQITWCLNHAHLLGGLSGSFLDVGFKFIVWRTTRPAAPA